MNLRTLFGLACIALTASLVPGPLVSQDADDAPAKLGPYAPDVPSMEQLMKAMNDARASTKFHQRLETFVGEWEFTMKLWMGGPDGPAMESKGDATIAWKIPGTWLETKETGSMMGMPTVKFGYFGYDNFKKKYVSFAITNLDNQVYTVTGAINPTGDTIYMYGTLDEASMGEVGKHMKIVVRIVSPDKHIMEVHDLGMAETNTKVVEYTYTRKK